MTQWAHRIEGVALTANIAAADALVAQLPGAAASRFSTGIPVRQNGTVVGRFISIAARDEAVAAAQSIIDNGLPAYIHAARIVPRAEEGSAPEWLASMGLEIAPLDF